MADGGYVPRPRVPICERVASFVGNWLRRAFAWLPGIRRSETPDPTLVGLVREHHPLPPGAVLHMEDGGAEIVDLDIPASTVHAVGQLPE